MYRIFLDIGARETGAGLLDESFTFLRKSFGKTNPSAGPDGIVEDAAALCKALIQEAGLSAKDIACVGLALRGVVDAGNGIVESAEALPFQNYPIAKALSEKLGGIPVYAEQKAK